MAMMDNVTHLLSQLRNGFITSDDTGICEIILEGEENYEKAQVGMLGSEKRPKTLPANLTNSSLDTDTELAHSIDIVPDMDFASHRRRSNTAQRLEKLKREKHKQSKIRHVQWKQVEFQPEIAAAQFEKIPVEKRSQKPIKSKLSLQLENFDTTSSNTFKEYAKFDGQSSVGLPAKKIDIFLMMTAAEDRAYPMTVVTLASAKVQELIGLICWQYTMEGRQPVLDDNVETYALHMAEDDGDVDLDFPALDPKEPMSKFGFAKLALVTKPRVARRETLSKPVIDVTVHHVGGFSTLTVDSDELSMRNIVDMVLERRKIRQRRGLDYRLEKKSSPGSSMDLDSSLGTTHAREFVLVRENSIRDDLGVVDVPHNQMAESLSSHQYKSFVVKLVRKLPIKQDQDVQIGIAGEKIEIDPTGANKTVLFKQKAVTYTMEDIAACLLLEEKSSGKGVFRLVYQRGHDFKHHDFECGLAAAKEIVTKVNNILDMRSSPVRKDYKVHREKKMNKRHTTLGF